MFEELLTGTAREIIGTMFHWAKGAGLTVDATPSKLFDEVRRASHLIHRSSQRAPANNIIANAEMLNLMGVELEEPSNGQIQKVAVVDGKWNVYLDPLFPEAEMLLWYNGPRELDSPVVYSPYTYDFTPWDHTKRKFMGRTRHKITLVRPEFTYVVRLNALDRIAKAVTP